LPVGRFVAGIGALVWDHVTDRYLILRRADDKDFAAGEWECVTGRVDQGEGFEEALHREVREEIGVDIQPLFLVGTTHFFRGQERTDNEVLGVVYCCNIDEPWAVSISTEHSAYLWVTAEEAYDLLTDRYPSERWLIEVIRRSELFRSLLPERLLRFHQEHGLQLD
jgi:8-oxo-dGTP diphosphatase